MVVSQNHWIHPESTPLRHLFGAPGVFEPFSKSVLCLSRLFIRMLFFGREHVLHNFYRDTADRGLPVVSPSAAHTLLAAPRLMSTQTYSRPAGCRRPTADRRTPTADCRLTTVDCRPADLPTTIPTADGRVSAGPRLRNSHSHPRLLLTCDQAARRTTDHALLTRVRPAHSMQIAALAAPEHGISQHSAAWFRSWGGAQPSLQDPWSASVHPGLTVGS